MSWSGDAERMWAQACLLLARRRNRQASPLALAAVRAEGWGSFESPMDLLWWGFHVSDRIPTGWVLTDRDASRLLLHPETFAYFSSGGAIKEFHRVTERPSGFHRLDMDALFAAAESDFYHQMSR